MRSAKCKVLRKRENKMKKLLTIAMITLAAVAAKADLFLYWTADVSGWDATYDIALYGGHDADMTSGELIDVIGINTSHDANIGSFGGVSAYTYYWVALYDQANTELTRSAEALTYTDIASGTWNSEVPGSKPDSAYTFTNFAAIPEPTSALMLLLGLGALALKRKVA